MADERVPVLPLTAAKVYLVSALFKQGGYRAYKTYQSKAKDMHVLAGFPWDVQLDLAFRKSSLSVLRGLGASRQSAPFDLILLLQKAAEPDVQLTDGAPIGWTNLLVIGTFFVMREIELAAALAIHLSIDEAARKLTLRLPVSKTDYRAIGCSRSWTCLCTAGSARADCPFCAGVAQLGCLRRCFGEPLPDRLPLFPARSGTACRKTDVIKTLEANLAAVGVPIQSESGERLFGGHSFRVTGAQRLATLGVEVSKIMVLARWASDAVLRYVREAPLEHLSAEVLELEAQQDLVQTIRNLESKIDVLADRVDQQAEGSDTVAAGLRQELDGHVANLQAQFAPTAERRVISKCGAGRHKVHLAQRTDQDAPPLAWRTLCGLGYAKWTFTRHLSTDEFPVDALCSKCFGRSGDMTATEVQDATSSSSSSSSRGSSST